MTELVKVTLSKDWEKHSAGSTVTVDAVRAEKLREMGLLDEPKPRRKRRDRVSEPKE